MSKNVRLKKLSLTNYRNIEHLELDFNLSNSAIVGENHIGKTNTLESLFFLLDDTTIGGGSILTSIKPLIDTKRTVSVEAAFDVDGEEFLVRKDYGEDWVRARGTDTLSMKGHFQKLFINGLKIERASEYYAQIRSKFGMPADDADKIDYMRMLMSPNYLGDIGEGKDWPFLRAFIIKLVGDVSDDDVFAANPYLSIIKEDLKKNQGSLDLLKRKYKQERDGIEATISQSEAVISNLEKAEKPTDDALAISRKAIEEHDIAISQLRSNSGSDVESERLQRELSAKQSELIEAQRKASESNVDPCEEIREQLRVKYKDARDRRDDSMSKRGDAMSDISACEIQIRRLEEERKSVSEAENEAIVERIKKIDSEPIQVEDTCPTCGQRLPEDRIEEAIAKVREARSAERESLVARCKSNKARRTEIDDAIVAQKNKIATIQDKIDELHKAIDQAAADMDKAKEDADALPKLGARAETPLESSLRREIAELEQRLKESRAAFQNGLQDTNKAIAEHQDAKIPYQKTLDDLAYYNRQQENLAKERTALEENKKKLAVAEQKSECASKFLYEKLKMLDDNVAKVFGGIKIKLIQENINGGFDPVCKPYIYDTVKGESTGVSWSSGSKSEKVETGIAILEAIKKARSMPDIPLIFDEGGEISSETFGTRLKTDAQLICVKVRDGIQSPTVLPL